MSESPNIVYGRLLESAHISGYSFERLTDELMFLLDGEGWKSVGPGYSDVNEFLKSIDLSPFNLGENRPKIHRRIKELQPQASNRAIAKATGVDKRTVGRDLNPGASAPPAAPDPAPEAESIEPSGASAPGAPEPHPARTEPPSPPAPFQRSAADIAKTTRKEAKKEAAAAESAERREQSRNAEPIPGGPEVREGDAREVLADVEDDSVALILTDPPYGDEAEPLYEWLGEFAARVLVPGGSLVAYTGQSRLDRDMRVFAEHLRYWWVLAMPHDQSQRLPGKFVVAEWKPVLWFVKDHRRGRTLVPDMLVSPAREKDDHPWGQGNGGVGPLIENLTEPGELIVDPFAGTAKWGQAALDQGRRWLGADAVVGGAAEVVA